MQTVLHLPHTPSHSREDFVVSDCNRHAMEQLDAWPNWPAYGLILIGAPSAGKTHLATLWQVRTNAAILTPESELSALAGQHVLLDNVDVWLAPEREAPLFHLLNQTKEQRRHILLTAVTPPSAWSVSLPDLVSRLNSLPQAHLHAPDEFLLAAVLTKYFADHQVKIDSNVIQYIVARSERSLRSIMQLAAALDARALAEKRAITIPLVKDWLETQGAM